MTLPRNEWALLGPDAGYAKWRSQIPFSNAEIIAALQTMNETRPDRSAFTDTITARAIESVQADRLSARLLRWVLPVLVKTCAVCGQTALYRVGCFGRCSDHRLVPHESVEEAKRVKNERTTERAAHLRAKQVVIWTVEKHKKVNWRRGRR